MHELEFYEIYDIWYEPPWFIRYKLWIVITLVVGFAFALCLYWYKKRARYKKPCWQRALEALAALDVRDHKNFYFALTSLLKNYIHERYCIDLYSKTDDEIVEYLEKNNAAFVCTHELKKIFSQTTLVKFAHHQADQLALQELRALSKKMIQNSIPDTTTKGCTS